MRLTFFSLAVMSRFTAGRSLRCGAVVVTAGALMSAALAVTPANASGDAAVKIGTLQNKGSQAVSSAQTGNSYLEGSVTDGTSWYAIGHTASAQHVSTSNLVKVKLGDPDAKPTASRLYKPTTSGSSTTVNELGHANDMTWNADTDKLMIPAWEWSDDATTKKAPDQGQLIRQVDPSSLKVDKTVKAPTGTLALCYDSVNNRYAGGVPGGKLWSGNWDSDGKYHAIKAPTTKELAGSPTPQGLECDSHYIYLLGSSGDKQHQGENHIYVLDWNFKLVKTYALNSSGVEVEAMTHRKSVFYLAMNKQGDTSYKSLHKVEDFQYQVAYDKNGGSGTMAATTVLYGNPTKLAKNKFTRSGYTFRGWHATRVAADASKSTRLYWNPKDHSAAHWYKPGAEPSGWELAVYSDGATVAKSAHLGQVKLSAVWQAN